MYGILVGILILDSVILATAVLLQAGQGGGLATMGGGAGTGAEHPAPHRNSTDGPPAGSGAAASAQSPALAQHPPTSFSRTAPGSPELRPSRLNRLTRKSFSPRI